MYKFTRVICALAVLLAMCPILTSSALAGWEQETLTNNTNRTATNLEKFLEGDVRITEWYQGGRFNVQDYGYDAAENVTTLVWSDGTVDPGQSTSACFGYDQNSLTHKYLPRWTYDPSGEDFLVAGPALSSRFFVEGDRAYLVLSNTALDNEPITIAEMDVGYADRVYQMEELVSYDVSGVEWSRSLSDANVPFGASTEQFAVPLQPGGVLIYRARLYLESQPDNVVECIGQYEMPRDNPTVSQWGLVVMAALLVSAGTIVIVRRRRQFAA